MGNPAFNSCLHIYSAFSDVQGTVQGASPLGPHRVISMNVVKVPGITAWTLHKHSPRVLHESSIVSVKAYNKTYVELAVTNKRVRKGYALVLALFNLFLNAVTHIAIADHKLQGKGWVGCIFT